ncbi:Phosphoglycerate mutase-like protein (AtPGM) [Durusdinium trenchii]|uniref:Phosphoglycerate mutase-like protein (AtPGM) n=1 Tax=Durusdinium trenchii TaxID=1381693 RepID=A0ABP0MUF5_9DINO
MGCFHGCLSFLRLVRPLPDSTSSDRRLLLVRHGESEYNVHYAKHHQDPGDFWDAPLTSTGEEQAASLKQKLLPEKVDLVVSSPLTRAIETALRASPTGPHLATPLASEHMEASCDIGRPTSELRAVYPKVDFQDLSEVWWYVPQECRQGITVEESRRLFTQEGRRESRKDFERRVDDFVSWLSQRPEKVIAIFAHADFFNCFLHRYFGETEAKYQDYWMKNCELLQLPLQKPLMPILHPSLPDAAIAAPREADVPVALTPSRAAQALETLRQDLAQQRPELTPKELKSLAAQQWKALSLQARSELIQQVVL